MSAPVEGVGASAVAAPGVNVYGGLLWREWLAHGGLVIGALAVWLVCGWVLELFFHPGFIIAFGVIYAFLAGPAFGGGEAGEGSEEFAFSLPPTRGERYIGRMLLGGGTVLAFTVLGVLTIALDLPQHLWGILVNSGFTEPFARCEPRFIYALAIAVPFAVFASSFALAATAASRGMVAASWFLGGLGAGAVTGLGFLGEYLLWGEVNGYISTTALVALAPLALLGGYLAYQRKEGVSRPAPIGGRSLWWVWLIVVVGIVFVLMLLGVLVARRIAEAPRMQEPAQTATEEPAALPERSPSPPAAVPKAAPPRPAPQPEAPEHAPAPKGGQ